MYIKYMMMVAMKEILLEQSGTGSIRKGPQTPLLVLQTKYPSFEMGMSQFSLHCI